MNLVPFDGPLLKATYLNRYKRFFADILLEDSRTPVTAHCPNTGSMKSCLWNEAIVYVSPAKNLERKLKYTLELVQLPGRTEQESGFIGVNTARPNLVVGHWLKSSGQSVFKNIKTIQPEAKYSSNSRIDFLVTDHDGAQCYVEVKNATLLEGDSVLFPDAVTTRGQKHLDDLISMKKDGHRAALIFYVNRPDGKLFRPAKSIDPVYAKKLQEAIAAGVEIYPVRVQNSLQGTKINGLLPLDMN
jgi:sugar fermentation stimulation protein A